LLVKYHEKEGVHTFPLKICGKCKENVIEMFKTQIKDLSSYENMFFQILNDPNLKVEFDSMKVVCPQCDEAKKGLTYIEMEEDDLKELNKAHLKDIWITVHK
jgi:protein-arginine kinase activator protein McsA